jgi:class 3 adenylate cyclase
MGGRRPLDLGFLESKPKIRARRVKALVAFGDMADFGAWTRRGSNSPEEFRSFMVRLYQEFIKFRNGNGYFVKLMGDGFMAVSEIKKDRDQFEVHRFLDHSLELDAAVNQISGRTFPMPGAFRIRIVAGYVWRVIAARPGETQLTQTDYLGYSVNLAARLLEVERETAILCHGSVKKILNGGSNEDFVLKRMATHNRCPRGIDPEDLKTLWTIQPLRNPSKAQTITSKIIPT